MDRGESLKKYEDVEIREKPLGLVFYDTLINRGKINTKVLRK